MRHFLCAIALTLPTSLAAQSTCEMRDAPVVPVFEPAKAAFLSGDWDLFAELATPLIPDGPEAFGPTLNQLKVTFPNGFASCQTILSRADKGGLVQEITTFNIPGVQGPMSLYLLASPVRGELAISYFYLNTAMRDVFEKLL